MENHTDRSLQENAKFQYYATALTFTLLAASVQSADLLGYRGLPFVLEILGWASLLISGLKSLQYLEKRGIHLNLQAKVDQDRESGDFSDVEGQSTLKSREDDIDEKRLVMPEIYSWARKFFIAGVCLVVAARALHGFLIVSA